MCALSNMFMIQVTMKKISVLHKETELQAKNKKVRLQLKGTVHPKMKILSWRGGGGGG